MKTAREAFKENFWIGAKGGLVDKKHYLKMAIAVWLFLHLLREQTALNQHGEGIVNYGHPLTFQQIGSDMKGIPSATIRKWTARLRREGYIRTESRGHEGLIFWIAKAKAKTRKVKLTHEQDAETWFTHEQARFMQERSPRANQDGEEIPSRANQNGEPASPRANQNGEREPKTPQVFSGEFVADVSETPIPKGFIPESLSYYNKDSHAQTACSPTGLLKELIRRRDVPRGPSAKELDQRRRELLRQGEEMARKYSTLRQPGQAERDRRA
jgi:hypothetical protein